MRIRLKDGYNSFLDKQYILHLLGKRYKAKHWGDLPLTEAEMNRIINDPKVEVHQKKMRNGGQKFNVNLLTVNRSKNIYVADTWEEAQEIRNSAMRLLTENPTRFIKVERYFVLNPKAFTEKNAVVTADLFNWREARIA